jgi:hypothetical protein
VRSAEFCQALSAADLVAEVGRVLKDAGHYPRRGEAVRPEYVRGLLALYELAGTEALEASGRDCQSGDEVWYDLRAAEDAPPVGVVWGRKDGRHVARAHLIAELVTALPALADALLGQTPEASEPVADEPADDAPPDPPRQRALWDDADTTPGQEGQP